MSAMLIFLVVSMTTVVFTQKLGCQEGWTMYPEGKTCMKVSDNTKAWREARAECYRDGGDLVKISDAGTKDFINDKLSVDSNYWTGLITPHSINRHYQPSYYWVMDKERSEDSFEWWDRGEPSNGHNEECVVADPLRNGRWNDIDCYEIRPFICQKEIEMEIIEQWSCDFEQGDFCTYNNVTQQTSNLYVQRAGDATLGPKKDHSGSENGYYALASGHGYAIFGFETSDIKVMDKHRCWTFWYRLNNANRIQIYYRVLAVYADAETRTYIGIPPEAENDWIKVYVDLYSDHPRRLMYLNIKFPTDTGRYHCAIDDMEFRKGKCESVRAFDARNGVSET